MRDRHVAIMHLVDSLALGGTEHVAVNMVNSLPRDRYCSYLCTTRCEGPLATSVAGDIGRMALSRRHTLDIDGVRHLVAFIRCHNIQLLHAHSSTLFVAVVASLFPPFPHVLWHDHYGRYAVSPRSPLPFWLLTRRVAGVIAVNQSLADWSRRALRIPASCVWYIPNFVCLPEVGTAPSSLPGIVDWRIICVANLRPEKDQLTLIQAMALVTRAVPMAHLLLVGAASDAIYRDRLLSEIARLDLKQHVTWLGQRRDVATLLRSSDIGVLSSASEGLPLALIEYGMAGLPVVATRVGQCAEVLDEGRAGLLVPPRAPDALAAALLSLLQSPARRASLGEAFQRRSQAAYSAEAIVGQICAIYDQIIGSGQQSSRYLSAPENLTGSDRVH